jgi:hypothetical protein
VVWLGGKRASLCFPPPPPPPPPSPPPPPPPRSQVPHLHLLLHRLILNLNLPHLNLPHLNLRCRADVSPASPAICGGGLSLLLELPPW